MQLIQRKHILYLSLWCLFSWSSARGDRLAPPGDKPSPPGNQHALIQSSGYIFSGTVLSVKYVASTHAGGVGVIRITFHVDNAVRGVRTGQTLEISEWAGLWQQGERYRAGEHVFLFLYPPSKLGFTSPVHGTTGRFAVGNRGRMVIRPEQRGSLPARLGIRLEQHNEIGVRDFAYELRMAREELP